VLAAVPSGRGGDRLQISANLKVIFFASTAYLLNRRNSK
jgi:hypothetical protein